MNNYNDVILKYRSGEMTISERENFKHDFFLNLELRKEYTFQDKLDKVMKKSLLLDALESDPDLIKAEILARQDIDNYLDKNGTFSNKRAINHFEVETEVELRKKIAKAEVEMVLSGIDDITEGWVKNFELRKSTLRRDNTAHQIIEYVNKSEPFKENVIQVPSAGHHITGKIVFQVAAAVLVMAMLLFKSLTPSFSGDAVFKRYYQPLEANSFQLRGNALEATSKLQEGVDYYLSKDYSKAELAFNNLRKGDKNHPEVLLYSGLNQMEQNNFPAAITFFSELLSGEDQFIPETQWYLGLCYLKTGDLPKARSLLETLSETEGIYKKKAQVILKNLNR